MSPATAPVLSVVGPQGNTINIWCVTVNTKAGYLSIDYDIGIKDAVTGDIIYQPQSLNESFPIALVKTLKVTDPLLPIFENARRAAYPLLLTRLQAKGLFNGAVVT